MRLLTELSKAGFISSTRGRNGGYVFARPLNTIFFSEIIDAIEGLSSFEGCILGSTVCPVDKPCPLHHIWENPKQAFLTTVKNTTLGDIKN